MKFFTKEWLSGERDDEEPYAADSKYQAHLNTIRDSFSTVLKTLYSYRLHDGLVKTVNRRIPENELFVTLVIGDLQVGYQRLDLTYRNAKLTQSDLEMLVRASRTEKIEILEDEWDFCQISKNLPID